MTPLEQLLEIATTLEVAVESESQRASESDPSFLEGAAIVAARDIRAAIANLTPRYTAEVPTEPGSYWWKPSDTTPSAFKQWNQTAKEGVYRFTMYGMYGEDIGMHQLCLLLPGDRDRFPAESMGGLWSGPILEPVEEVKYA